MAIQQKIITTYTIDGHPDPELCYTWVRDNWPDLYSWHGENIDSLKAFCNHFDVSLNGYSINCCGQSYVDIGAEFWGVDDIGDDELKGIRLWKYLNNNNYLIVNKKTYSGELKKIISISEKVSIFGECHFTGYIMDEALLDPIKKFMDEPDANMTMQDLMNDCADNFIKFYSEDWEYQYSDEGLKDMCIANDYYFNGDGSVV